MGHKSQLYAVLGSYTWKSVILIASWHTTGTVRIKLILDRYAGTTHYAETRGSIEYGTLGSGESITMISSVLGINEEDRHIWIVYVDMTTSGASWREYIVFFFYNGSNTREIDKNLLLEITNYATKMF